MKKNFLFVSIVILLVMSFFISCESNNKAPSEDTGTNKVEVFTVTFNSNLEGAESEVVKVESGKTISKKILENKIDYKFEGWYIDNQEFDFSKPITKNITLIARWTPIFSDWDGTNSSISLTISPDGKYHISSASDFSAFANMVNNGNDFKNQEVILDIHVNLNNYEWKPIGEAVRTGKSITNDGKVFSGTFDGREHIIKGLKISNDNNNNNQVIGLFGAVNGGSIKNIEISQLNINTNASECVGGAVGLLYNNANAENLSVSGTINAKQAGGVIGRMIVSGSIKGCTNSANIITTGGGSGGIVGKAYYSEADKKITISDCKNTGNITSEAGYIGGIVGLLAGDISNCINKGKVSGKDTSIGGIVGEQTNYGVISECINEGSINNSGDHPNNYGLAGIVGWIRYQNNDSYTRNEIIKVINNKNTGNILGQNCTGVGGIVGMLFNTGVVTNNTSTASELKGYNFVSGIVGAHQKNTENLYSSDDDIRKVVIKDNIMKTPIEKIITNNCGSTIVYWNETGIEADIQETVNIPSTT